MKASIVDILKPLNVPVCRLKYSGTAPTYITYFIFNEMGDLFADNEEIVTGYHVQVDIWSKGDYTDIENQLKELMTAAGFKRTYAIELYEEETHIYHKAIRFFYEEVIV
jgi:hypothetical protein